MRYPQRCTLLALLGLVLAAGCTAPTKASPPAVAESFCEVALPSAWHAALTSGRLPARAGERLIVQVASEDGGSLFVQVTTARTRELVWFRGDARTTVMAVTDPINHQFIGGGFDGRWLVFAVGYNLREPHDWAVYAWDSVTATAPRQIANNRRAVKSPWIQPTVHAGKAAWIEGVDGLQARVHLFDLASHTDRVVHTGAATGVFFLGSWLVWREGYDNAPAPLRAIDMNTGSPAALPAALAAARSARYANGSGSTVVWDTADSTTAGAAQPAGTSRLMAWRNGWRQPRQLITARPERGETVEWPYTSGDFVSFGNGKAFYVADLRTGAYTQVTPAFGGIRTFGNIMVIGFYSTEKSTSTTAIVRASQLPALPGCA